MAATAELLVLALALSVVDVHCQDNTAPLFRQPLYVFPVNEELRPGSLIGTVEAFDLESDALSFFIDPSSLNADIFVVNGSANIGEIYFTGPRRLDREILTPTNQPLSVNVMVSDGITRGVANAQAEVRVFLRDINDNAPIFTNLPMSVDFNEDADINTVVFDVQATDADFAANSLLLFYIVQVDGIVCGQCDRFDIDVSTGVVTLTQSLDFDAPSGSGRQHTIVVQVQDRGTTPLTDEQTLTIVVNDVNDRNPLFLPNSYSVEIHENLTFGDPIVEVSALDQDFGINDAIVYRIISGNLVLNGVESFGIDNETGVIYVNTATLDRETHTNYLLTVQASESMDADRTDTAFVQITVRDINDHAPFFLQSFYTANVSENAGMDTVVVVVTAMDRDTGVHAEFEFILENLLNSSEPLPFSVRHDVLSGEGSIVLTREIDFESETIYNFRVIARELLGDLAMNGSTTVTINVINENDNSPVFLNSSYFVSIPENIQPPAFIALVTAIDADIGTFGEVEYSLSGSNPLFVISPTSGRVETTDRLDYETQTRYVFTVQARDRAEDQRNLGAATLTVDIENLNDNPPRFDVNLTMVSIDEELLAPQLVLTLEADDDDGDLTEHTFMIVSGNDEGHFIIVGNELQTSIPLDYDLLTNGTQDYLLTISVNDTVNIDVLDVYIRVIDINDNTPAFDNTSYRFDVFENEQVGYLVGEVNAVDIDSGTFGLVEYSLSGPGATSFEVNSTTGEIRTAVELDRELQSTPFELVVMATDIDATPANRRQVSVPLVISVLDRNDNNPVFERSTYIFELEENTELVELQVRATDIDIGSNMEISYSIVNSNVNNTFIIDETSGVISRNSIVHLDYERVQQYVLNVSAMDGGDDPNSSTVEVIVNILDVNDVIPTFESTLYNSTIREDITADSIVTQITAMDADSNENGQLFYSIVINVSLPVDAPSGSFVVEETSGIIRTTGSFDREAFSGPYTIMMFVRDGGFPISHNGSTTLLVYIDDSNDNGPIFMPSQYSASVAEELPAGQSIATVSASDGDRPSTPNSDIEYSIANVFATSGSVDPALNLLEHFSVDGNSGLVQTNTSLDFEQISSYRIVVQASDLGSPQRSSNVFVTVSVVDVNDQPPVLSEELYQLNVTENTPVNTRFNLISATDADSATANSQITYSADISTPFRVDINSGELVLTSILDFELSQSHMLMVNATDGVFVDEARVIISVFDVNDNTPDFQQETYSVDVDEGNYTSTPQQLLMVSATDDDSGLLGTVEYDIFPFNELFSVDFVSGAVSVVGDVDRETQLSHVITILARDGGIPPETATATLIVNILDINDNRPVLESPAYSAVIVENTLPGQILAMVRATDEDAGSNGAVEYSFQSPSSDFNIDRFSGEVTNSRAFDFEKEPSFQLTVVATDNSNTAPLSATALLTVSITDVNDNGPIFTNLPRSLRLSENTQVSSAVTSVMATDTDSGDNGLVLYQLANDEGKFSINATTGDVIVSESLDREVSSMYNLTVTAVDRGQPQRSAVQNILIDVLDVNDVIPMFERDSYSFVVPEDLNIGNTIGSISVVDSDLGSNADTIFTLVQGDANVFRIQRSQSGNVFTGHIINNQRFDYEVETAYSLVIQATNTAPPGNFTTATVEVSIRDINDNPPIFSMRSGYTLRIAEGTLVGTPVGTVVATDNDGGVNGTVVYDFSSATSALVLSTFAIGNSSGVLSLIQSLDFERERSYTFQIVARDSAVERPLSSSVTVQVMVEDENEASPVFDRTSYSGLVQENASPGQSVLSVNATESDATSIEYSIVAGSINRFTINSDSGLITTTELLDREEQDRYVLTVQARDTGSGGISLSSFVQVDITVEDENDNPPVFSASLFEFTLPEHSSVGTSLTTLLASDPDEGTNALISYSIDQGRPFTVDSNTGLITVISPDDLNREASSTVDLLLTATDRGRIPRSNNVRLRIVLSDINDNDPVFVQPSYTASVPENSPSGVSIVTVQASDLDGDTPSYTIVSGDDSFVPKFRINSNTGLIETTDNPLDREMLESVAYTIILRVEANDQRATPRTTVVPVVISVVDVNDFAPNCGGSYSYSVAEDNSLNVRIGQVVATDGDSGQNAVVNYHIASGDSDGDFQISSTSGELFGRPGLDFEASPIYVLGVAAVDQAPDPADRMTSICMVTVTLIDENDNRPLFDQAVYEAVILENATLGTTVTVVGATDLDSGVNGLVSYAFQSPTRAFSIDGRFGIITVSDSLDSETVPLYELDVEARDGGSPPRIGSTRLVVRVSDVNDNSPRFDRSIYMQTVSEDDPVDTTVINLDATDVDSSSISYAIFRGNQDGYFKINTLTGVIQTARSLDREQLAVVHLGVSAMDKDGNTGNTTVQVTIEDVNDEAPQFLQPAYYARVAENSPVRTQVLPILNMTTIRIEAVDADAPNTQNSRVLYSHVGPNSDLFVIDFDTAILSVARGAELDHESLPVIAITIIASDSVPAPNTRSSSVLLTIEVVDENDEAPRFTQPFGYVIPIEEDARVNSNITTEVQATDPDTGRGGEIEYFISTAIPLEATSWFNIDRQSGYISLVESLDRESYGIITLMVTAADQGVPSLSSIVNVQISLSDVNDNPPQFSQDIYSTTVPEFLATGAAAFQVLAQDPDVGSNAAVRYSLQATPEPFSINPITGVITTTNTLDHETRDQHVLIVQACDGGAGPLCDTATVVVNVGDFNDEVPQFDVAAYTVDTCETAQRDDAMVQPVATDRDSGSNSDIIYSLEGITDSLFSVDQVTGLIFLTRDLDVNDVNVERYEFRIIATDSGSTPLSSTAQVVVRIVNCTDEDFVFEMSRYYFEIDEGALLSESLSLRAQVSFSSQFFPEPAVNPLLIISGDVLNLKSPTALSILGIGQGNGLDREVRSLYTVIVRAEERVSPPATHVPRVAFTSVTLLVQDINDNRPMFLSNLYVFSVFENSTNPMVGRVEAVDMDTGLNAVLSYRISSVSPSPDVPFSINSTAGVITTTRKLDRESVQRYEIIVQASDDGGLAVNSSRVVVNVEDINDCTPTFSRPVYNVNILENLQPGASVATVIATDCDIGNNGVVQYSVVGGDLGVFQLDLVSGEITTLVTLDFELQNTYFLRVRAIDMGVPSLSSEQIVNIFVEDFNDCPPEFIGAPTSMTLLENTTLGSVVVDLNVEDCDSGDNGVNGTMFSVIAGNEDGAFMLNGETGVLFTVSTLDRETVESYSLSIQARDSAGVNSLSSVIQLTVIVGDVNDNEPVFDESLILITINEREELNQVLIDISASDADQGANGIILYSVLGGQGVFGIDENTGSVSLLSSLDREMVDNYELTIVARDRAVEPRSSNTSIIVTVQDDNDNNPLIINIISGVTVVEVLEDTDIGTRIFVVNATDEDDGSNAQISYFLTDSNLPFDISRSGGAIRVNGVLDYEGQNEYTLVVAAVDGGSPQQLSSVASLRVRITDRNDNPPIFPLLMYSGSLDEGVSVGNSILTVIAEDDDQTGSVNAQVEYSLIDGDINYFSVHPTSGVISNTVVLDREMQSLYSFTVLANNTQSDFPLTGTATVQITVRDINDEYPVFDESFYNGTLSELSVLGTTVLTVHAVDGDQANDPNSDLIYSLTRMVNNPFHIDPTSGVLTVLNSLDYETATFYELEVVAEDKGSVPLRNTSTIRINVLDRNDVAPFFDLASYSGSVGENISSFPALLANLSFTDQDSLPAHRVSSITIDSVTLDNGEAGSPAIFLVATNQSSLTGQVFLTEAVDFELVRSFSIVLNVANDNTGEGLLCGVSSICQLSGQSVLEVTVVDANDNSPVFTSQLYSGEVSVSAPPGTSLLTISANDADITPEFARVSYELLSTADGTIRVDPDTGTLFTRGSFENRDGEILSLTVVAVDNMGNSPSNTASATVEMVVLNDFQRVAINFACGIDVVQRQELFIISLLANFTSYGIVVEDYSDYSSNTQTTFIFHAIDTTNMIVDFDRFSATIQNRELQLFSQLNATVCNVTDITSFADLEGYTYPPLLDTETIVILVLCLLLIIGSLFLLIMALRQRVLGLSETRHRKLGEVFFATPGSTSFINEQHGQYREEVEMKGNFQSSPMYLEPFETWAGMETSGGESIGESSLQRDNPLYESQEIRMEMFVDDSEEEEGDADDAELLAAALEDDLDDEEEEDNSITAI